MEKRRSRRGTRRLLRTCSGDWRTWVSSDGGDGGEKQIGVARGIERCKGVTR